MGILEGSANMSFNADWIISTEAVAPVAITQIKLFELFGLYDYELPGLGEAFGRSPIFYGDNGLGKTNILKILFHLLSYSGNKGHRTALGKIRFRRVEVLLSNDIQVVASRNGDSLIGAMRLEVLRHEHGVSSLLGAWDWFPEDDPGREAIQRFWVQSDPELQRRIANTKNERAKSRVMQQALLQYFSKESNPLESEETFLQALRENVPPIYFLSADRTLSSDHVPRDSSILPESEWRSMRPDTMVSKGRERAINDAIGATSRRLSQLAVRATRQGSKSTHSIYHDLLRRLASRSNSKIRNAPQSSIADLEEKLIDLSSRYELYSKYGIAPSLDGRELVKLLKAIRPADISVARDVLQPYVESLVEQANSLDRAYLVIDTLVSTINAFLYDKFVEFSLGDGMIIRSRMGDPLEPKDLSSGEQQLLLLFCHITLARDSGGIFIIDEPEISLNIKWQRRLVDALWSLDPEVHLQFILASHSMEILARHRDSVVTLREASNG